MTGCFWCYLYILYILHLICRVRSVMYTAFWKNLALCFPVDVETNSTPSFAYFSV